LIGLSDSSAALQDRLAVAKWSVGSWVGIRVPFELAVLLTLLGPWEN
jgi:hypothetical protein